MKHSVSRNKSENHVTITVQITDDVDGKEIDKAIRKTLRKLRNLLNGKLSFEYQILDSFKKKTEHVAEEYADIVTKTIHDAKKLEEVTPETIRQINEGIRMLNYVANTLERIHRIQAEKPMCGVDNCD